MRRLCPSLSELSAFHASARHLSFTQAAQELSVTQSAISRHVAGLEQFLSARLFVRHARGLQLTAAGLTYLNATAPALKQLETATSHLMSHRGLGGVLNLSVPPTFATQWLFPRMNLFRQQCPDVNVNFVRYQHLHDFAASHELDAAIQFGDGIWPHAVAQYLIGRENCVVCSPELRDSEGLRQPEDLVRMTLLQHVEVPYAWQEWLQTQGLARQTNGLFGPRFNQYSLIARAATSGFGVAILPSCLVEQELRDGSLVEPFARRYETRSGYFLCAPLEKQILPAFGLFGQWIQDAIRNGPPARPGR